MSLNRLLWVTPNWGFDSADASGDFGCIKPANISVGGSMLSINVNFENATGQNANAGTYQGITNSATYTYGLVYSTFLVSLGDTVEVRARMSGGRGDWPAIWLINGACEGQYFNQIPASSYSQEIDIAEFKPGVSGGYTTVYQNTIFKSGGTSVSNTATVTDASQNFHTYKITWTSGALTWFVDGVQTNQITSAGSIPSLAMFLVLGQSGIGITTAGGTPNSADYPQTMQVDYVKVTGSDGVIKFFDDFN